MRAISTCHAAENMAVDWHARLRGLSVDDIASALSSMPADVQEHLETALKPRVAQPWDMASGSTAELLHELNLQV